MEKSPNIELSSKELSRYARHLMLPEVGKKGQMLLKDSSVLVVGAGGLGSPVALYLAAAGIGTLGLVDFDEGSCHRMGLVSFDKFYPIQFR